MLPTPYADLNTVLSALVEGLRPALGESLVGVYLQGSFALGDFDGHSDVDFIAAIRDELSEDEVARLQALHPSIYEMQSEWAKHLEGSYFPLKVLRSCHGRGKKLWYLDHGARSLILSEHCNTAVVRSTLREHGVVLTGPRPAELIDPVPVALLRTEIAETMRSWGEEILREPERFANHFYQAFIVLSYCRMLNDLLNGRVGSKRAGAEWAKRTLDPRWVDLIDGTWDGRPDPAASVRRPADPSDFARTLEFICYVNAEMEKRLPEVLARRRGRGEEVV